MYSETCINRSRSKAETLLRRTDTFDPVCFLYAFLPLISKAKTVKRTLLQTNNFFSPQIKRASCLTPTQINILGISEEQRIKLDIFVNFLKKNHFLDFKTTIIFFWFRFAVLKEWDTFESNSVSFFPTTQLLLCVTESNIGQGPSNHTPPLYEVLASVVWLTLSFGEVSKTCRRMH